MIKNITLQESVLHKSIQLFQQAAAPGAAPIILNKKKLSGDYIAGFVQADGSFSARLTRKTRGDKEYLNISLVFTIVQSQKYKELILEIQKKFGGIGH